MKMCSSSVEPMPSIRVMPVASCHSARVAAGSASPADTHWRSGVARKRSPWAARARYEVGAVNRVVAPKASMPSSRCGGPAFSSSTVLAPTLIGNSSRPPRPKVKASGGLPMKTSSGRGRRMWRGKAAQAAITSRWKRSEEHTSELQSHHDLVCRLLLEKKKKKNNQKKQQNTTQRCKKTTH